MEFDEKLDLCADLMAEEFCVSSHTAWTIINNLNLEDIMFDYYEDKIREAEEEQEAKWDREIELNPDLYKDDIHGGV